MAAVGDKGSGGARDALIAHVEDKSADVYVTFVSILIGVVFADLFKEARARMLFWPLDEAALLTWAQFAGTAVSALGTWVIYAQLGISRRTVPGVRELWAAMTGPALIFVATSFVGTGQDWPWFYAAAAFLSVAAVSVSVTIRAIIASDGAAHFRILLRPTGFLGIVYLSAPGCLVMGIVAQAGHMPMWLSIVLTAGTVPLSIILPLMFLRDWRACLDSPEARTPRPEAAAEPDTLRAYATGKSTDVFVTLVSIAIGMVIDDLFDQIRDRMVLWPLDLGSLRTWGQIGFQLTAAATSWAIYAHYAIARRQLPLYGETLSATYAPALLLLLNGFIGRPEFWPWAFAACGFGLSSVIVNTATLRLYGPENRERFRGMMRPTGFMAPVYLGTPTFLVAGVLDYFGRLPDWVAVALVLPLGVLAILHVWMFLTEWRRRILG